MGLLSFFKNLFGASKETANEEANKAENIFQQAKDQKQDPGLFFVSTIAVYLVLYLFLKYV